MKSRNTKPEYIRKLLAVNVNGFKVDIGNYLQNPAYGCEYPALIKQTGESEGLRHYMAVKYFKYYGGRGEYSKETYSLKKSETGWSIVQNHVETVIEQNDRYSFPHLQELAKAI